MRKEPAMLKKASTAAVALLVTSLIGTSANAHPKLISANPIGDVSTSGPLTEIRLNFSEGVISKFSTVELQDQAGKKIPIGTLITDPKDDTQLIVPLQAPLNAGTYTVKWIIVSVDTHRVNGSYSFKVDR
jgi:methionine-rich copper-binding protein CopC